MYYNKCIPKIKYVNKTLVNEAYIQTLFLGFVNDLRVCYKNQNFRLKVDLEQTEVVFIVLFVIIY